jgi:hypothetical protein
MDASLFRLYKPFGKPATWTDMYVSTLRSYIEAMGGELEIVARFPDGNVKIKQFTDLDQEPPQGGKTTPKRAAG